MNDTDFIFQSHMEQAHVRYVSALNMIRRYGSTEVHQIHQEEFELAYEEYKAILITMSTELAQQSTEINDDDNY